MLLLQVVELYKAADKYEVLGLLQECTAAFRALTGAAEVAPLLQVWAARLRALEIPQHPQMGGPVTWHAGSHACALPEKPWRSGHGRAGLLMRLACRSGDCLLS